MKTITTDYGDYTVKARIYYDHEGDPDVPNGTHQLIHIDYLRVLDDAGVNITYSLSVPEIQGIYDAVERDANDTL